jgi:hypothetical protein
MANAQGKPTETTPKAGTGKTDESEIKQGAQLQKSLSRFVRFPHLPVGSINGVTIEDDHVTGEAVNDEFVKSLETQFPGIVHEDVTGKDIEAVLKAREERQQKLGV